MRRRSSSTPTRTKAEIARAERLLRSAAADGADLVVLPEKFNVLGGPDDLRAAPSRSPARPPIGPRPSAASSDCGWSRGASSSGWRATTSCATRRCWSAPTAGRHLRKIHLFDVEVDGMVYRESDVEARRRGRRRGRRRPAARHGGLLRPALPGVVPDHGESRRAGDLSAGGVHRPYRSRALGDPRARPRDRETGVRDRGRPDRRASARPRATATR